MINGAVMHICVVADARAVLQAVRENMDDGGNLTRLAWGPVAESVQHPGVWHMELYGSYRLGGGYALIMETIGEIIGQHGIAFARGMDDEGEEGVAFWDGRYLHMLPLHFFEEDDDDLYREPEENELFLDWLTDVKMDVLRARYGMLFSGAGDTEGAWDEEAFLDWFTLDFDGLAEALSDLRAEFADEWAQEQACYIEPEPDPEWLAARRVWGQRWRHIAACDAEGLAGYLSVTKGKAQENDASAF